MKRISQILPLVCLASVVLYLSISVAIAEPVATAPAVNAEKEVRQESVVQSQENNSLKKENKFSLVDWKRSQEEPPPNSLWLMMRGLGGCLGFFFILLFLYKKLQPKSQLTQKRRLRVLERLPISPKTALLLVEVSGRELLLTVGQDRVSFADNKAVNSESFASESLLEEAFADEQAQASQSINEGGKK